MLPNGLLDNALNFGGGYSRDRAGPVLSPTQGGTDIESVPDPVLAGKARAHATAPVVEEFSLQQRATFRVFGLALDDIGLEQRLQAVKSLAVDDRLVLAFEPFAAVMDFTEIDPVLEEVGEGAISEGNAAIVFGDFRVTALGDDAALVEISHQAGKGFALQVPAKDGSDRLGLGLVDDKLLVPGIITQRDCPPGPFALLSGGGDLVPDPLGGKFPLELGKGEKDIERQPAHRGGRVELLGDRHKGDRAGIKGLDQLGKISQRPGETVDL